MTCSECPKGSYADGLKSTECLKCPKGTYQPKNGQGKCIECNNFEYQDEEGMTESKQCSTLCKTGCNSETGYCLDCSLGFEINIENGDCVECEAGSYSDYTTNNTCKLCPVGTYCNSKKCTRCEKCFGNTYSDNIGSSRCKKCDESCDNCDKINGSCLNCALGYGFTSNRLTCEICLPGEYSINSTCYECPDGYYSSQNGSSECYHCPISCKNNCNKQTGKCEFCKEGYGLYNESICIECEEHFYSDGKSECQPCSSSCESTYCDKRSGECLNCPNGQSQVTRDGKQECVSCSNDKYCDYCSKEINQTELICLHCQDGFTFDKESNKCIECSIFDSHCNICSRDNLGCLECKGNYVIENGKCIACSENELRHNNKCISYDILDPNCELYEYDNEKQQGNCTKCYSPYELNINTNKCQLCDDSDYHYDNKTNKCELNMDNCQKQINNVCYQCYHGYILTSGKCISSEGECHLLTEKTCEVCEDNNIITTNGNCSLINNCTYSMHNTTSNECLKCEKEFENNKGKCEINKNCSMYFDDICIKTTNENNYIDSKTNEIKQCINSDVCQMINDEIIPLQCSSGYYRVKEQCHSKSQSNCSKIENGDCLQCKNGTWLFENECYKNTISYCIHQSLDGKCLQCEKGKYLSSGKCIDLIDLNCPEYDEKSHKCNKCKNETEYYQDQGGCFARIGSIYENCKNLKISENKCLECFDGYVLLNDRCYISLNNARLKQDVESVEENCKEKSSKGCIRCNDGFYNDGSNCVECKSPCQKCANETYCTGCNMYSILVNGTCVSMNKLIETCDNMWPNNEGCVNCKDGYYKSENGRSCDLCHVSCGTCLDKNTCLTCNENYYMTSSTENKLCKHFNESIGCIQMTQSGCLQCIDGMYLSNYECETCPNECLTCSDQHHCKSCGKDYVLKDSKCIYFTEIEHCKSANNSQCQKCDSGYELNDNGNECHERFRYGLYVGVPIVVIIIIIGSLIVILVFTLKLIEAKRDYQPLTDVTILKMSKSDIKFHKLNKIIVANKKILDIENEYGQIPVNEETRMFIVIGNKSSNRQKIQIIPKDKNSRYEINIKPEMVSLKKGEACEFEITIKPLCMKELEDELMIIAVDIKKGNKTTNPLKLKMKTQHSIRLDFAELEIDNQIGEGAFSTVYRGSYKGYQVAIKKMKNMDNTVKSIQDFEKEVAMLDKFRCDYIVHFYGASFIPNRIAIVLEYAHYGSIFDCMKESRIEIPSLKLKTKFILDVARGIQYLHTNGIMHRDIKPENVLVFRLDENVKVNAKLTDFGSSRNLNQMMTNLTFTKGVGTPIYMAPEVIQLNKYKKSADIYAFGLSMYEIWGWTEAFPKPKFKFAWRIAEFISSGQRPEKLKCFTQKQFDLIEKCWCHNAKERLTIEDVIPILEMEMVNIIDQNNY